MKTATILIMIILVTSISGCVQEQTGAYEVDYYGNKLLFNSNLDEAQNISVVPDEAALKETLFGYRVAELQLSNYNNSEEQPYYSKAYISFASKYAKLSLLRWNYDMSGKVEYVVLIDPNSLPNATQEAPAILLMGPSLTNQTYIKVDGNRVMVYADNLEMRQGKYAKYTDFDLALDKIILVLMQE